jgi:hypothetical protein
MRQASMRAIYRLLRNRPRESNSSPAELCGSPRLICGWYMRADEVRSSRSGTPMTLSTVPQSVALRAIGPILSSAQESAIAP